MSRQAKGLIHDNCYDGLGQSTEMQKYRIRLFKQNLGRKCWLKEEIYRQGEYRRGFDQNTVESRV